MASDWLFQIAWYFCTNQIASILVEHSLTSKMTSLHVNEISSGKLRYLVASIHFGAFLFFWALCYFFSSFDNLLWRLFLFSTLDLLGNFSISFACIFLFLWHLFAFFSSFGLFFLILAFLSCLAPILRHFSSFVSSFIVCFILPSLERK